MFSAIIPSHQVGTWLLSTIDGLLDSLGLSHDKLLEEIIYMAVIVIAAIMIGWVIRRLILFATRKFVSLRNTDTGRELLAQHVFTRCSHIIPPMVILGLLPFAFDSKSKLLSVMEIIIAIYLIVAVAVGINTVLTFLWNRFDAKDNTKNLPLKGILNIAKGLVWIIVAILSGSIILDKSPIALLTGLGAFAAALMLIFKDSILGFVAGIQLSQNDMLRVGDWIVVPSTLADGVVIDVSLSAVKVRNWNNTIVTCPPYTLVSTSFQNWRGMTEAGARQISRSVIFDTDSIKPCTDELIQTVTTRFPQIKDYVDGLKQSGKNNYDPGTATVNGTIETNLGLFRAYMCRYLLDHPLISNTSQILVRVMVPSGEGMPLQIYCYTTTQWTAYEAVQSQIFEHIAAVCPVFGLALYNSPAGADIDRLQAPATQSAPRG